MSKFNTITQTKASPDLPTHFYYNGIFYTYHEGKISKVGDEPVPSGAPGLVQTDEISHRVNYLQGRILTIIDASFADKDQKKAIKDLIKQVMAEEHGRLEDSATGFHTLTKGDMIQFSGSEEKFYEDNIPEEIK